jgi:predicted metal-dependent hydrolase
LSKVPQRREEFQRSISIDGAGTFYFTLIRAFKRRTSTILIDEDARLKVYTSLTYPETAIFAFLQKKKEWIARKLKEQKNRVETLKSKQWEQGSELLFLGERYPILFEFHGSQTPQLSFSSKGWIFSSSDNLFEDSRRDALRKEFVSWYRQQALEVLGSRVVHHSRNMKVPFHEVAVRTQKRLWGSCHIGSKKIHLNWKLVMAPMDVIDYVVVHELAHLLVPNHSKRFWSKVEQYMPDYKERHNWLKKHSVDMVLP